MRRDCDLGTPRGTLSGVLAVLLRADMLLAVLCRPLGVAAVGVEAAAGGGTGVVGEGRSLGEGTLLLGSGTTFCLARPNST